MLAAAKKQGGKCSCFFRMFDKDSTPKAFIFQPRHDILSKRPGSPGLAGLFESKVSYLGDPGNYICVTLAVLYLGTIAEMGRCHDDVGKMVSRCHRDVNEM